MFLFLFRTDILPTGGYINSKNSSLGVVFVFRTDILPTCGYINSKNSSPGVNVAT